MSEEQALIFLVDDDPILGRFVRKALEMDGFEVREFLRGEDFLGAVRSKIPDLVRGGIEQEPRGFLQRLHLQALENHFSR